MRNTETIPSLKGELTFSNCQQLNGTMLTFRLSVLEYRSINTGIRNSEAYGDLKNQILRLLDRVEY